MISRPAPLHVLKFVVETPVIDSELSEKLDNNRTDILDWLIRGVIEFKNHSHEPAVDAITVVFGNDVVSNAPELSSKLALERSKILEFLLRGVSEFQKQCPRTHVDAQHVTIGN